jgi:hypothetical protein
VFGEVLELPLTAAMVAGDAAARRLVVEAWDKDRGTASDFLGEVPPLEGLGRNGRLGGSGAASLGGSV